MKTTQERIKEVGLAGEPKYRFLLGPLGLFITIAEKEELEKIGRAALQFVKTVDEWYRRSRRENRAGSWLVSVLNTVIPQKSGYRSFPHTDGLPTTFMVDTILTSEGWRVVEVDVTNRNAMGYPLIMRYLYDLPSIWLGIDEEWRQRRWSGVTQIMASHHRFYEPYFRYFLSKVDGKLVKEDEIETWLAESAGGKLLDLPIFYKSREIMPKLMEIAREMPIAIPPKHYLSSKGLTVLPWEMNLTRELPLKDFLPEGRMLCRNRPLPQGDFFVKMLQSSGAHGTFYNNRDQLDVLHRHKKPKAIWQKALPITTRVVTYLDEDGTIREGNFYIRVSIFVNQNGDVVDADATCSPEVVVHGAKRAVMTVPVLG